MCWLLLREIVFFNITTLCWHSACVSHSFNMCWVEGILLRVTLLSVTCVSSRLLLPGFSRLKVTTSRIYSFSKYCKCLKRPAFFHCIVSHASAVIWFDEEDGTVYLYVPFTRDISEVCFHWITHLCYHRWRTSPKPEHTLSSQQYVYYDVCENITARSNSHWRTTILLAYELIQQTHIIFGVKAPQLYNVHPALSANNNVAQ